MPNIKLQSSDGEVLEVDAKIAKCSVKIKAMLEDPGMDEGSKDIVSLPNVRSKILKKVIQWATYHKDDPPPMEYEEHIDTWDVDFLKVDQGTLIELTKASKDLEIKGLLDVTCKTIAKMMEGKTAEEIRTMFNKENDLTLNEEEH